MGTNDTSQMLNPKEVAEILGIHQKTVHLWLRTGKLEGVKISYRSWRIPKTALDAFIEKNKNINQNNQNSKSDPIKSNKKPHSDNQISKKESNLSQKNMKCYIRDIMGEQSEPKES